MFNPNINNLEDVVAYEVCPHCASKQAMYRCVEDELVLTCMCGYYKVLYSEKGGVIKTHCTPQSKAQLPRQGTKLSVCLGSLASFYPNHATTGQVATVAQGTSSDVASQLMVLQHKGLVEKIADGRGVSGGSTWHLTHASITKLGLRRA